jgi:hypothetical protein
MGESLIVNQYSGQVNNKLRSHLETCERLLSMEEEKTIITSRKINKFKDIIKNEDGSFNEQKFGILASEVQSMVDTDFLSSQILQKVQQRSEDRLLNIDRSLPPFPMKKVVPSKKQSPINRFADGFADGVINLFGIFGITVEPAEKSDKSDKSDKSGKSGKSGNGTPTKDDPLTDYDIEKSTRYSYGD